MSQELLYTSAPQGLKPGSRGFCTVVSTQGMAANLAERLEALSGYRHVFPPQDPLAALNPICWSQVRFTVGGRPCHVLSRIAAAGLDYTQRSNKIAHHVVLDATELVSAGPAAVLAADGFMETGWDGKTRILPAGRRMPTTAVGPGICEAWKTVTGDAGWGGVLAEAGLGGSAKPAFIVFRPGVDLLPLFCESLALLAPERRWQVTFCSYFTKLPPGVDCQWRGVVDGSPEAQAARRTPGALLIDLCRPLPRATGGPLVEVARTGAMPVTAQTPAAAGPATAASEDDFYELEQLLGDEAADATAKNGRRQVARVPLHAQSGPPAPPIMGFDQPMLMRPFKKKPRSRGPIVFGLTMLVLIGVLIGSLLHFRGVSKNQLQANVGEKRDQGLVEPSGLGKLPNDDDNRKATKSPMRDQGSGNGSNNEQVVKDKSNAQRDSQSATREEDAPANSGSGPAKPEVMPPREASTRDGTPDDDKTGGKSPANAPPAPLPGPPGEPNGSGHPSSEKYLVLPIPECPEWLSDVTTSVEVSVEMAFERPHNPAELRIGLLGAEDVGSNLKYTFKWTETPSPGQWILYVQPLKQGRHETSTPLKVARVRPDSDKLVFTWNKWTTKADELVYRNQLGLLRNLVLHLGPDNEAGNDWFIRLQNAVDVEPIDLRDKILLASKPIAMQLVPSVNPPKLKNKKGFSAKLKVQSEDSFPKYSLAPSQNERFELVVINRYFPQTFEIGFTPLPEIKTKVHWSGIQITVPDLDKLSGSFKVKAKLQSFGKGPLRFDDVSSITNAVDDDIKSQNDLLNGLANKNDVTSVERGASINKNLDILKPIKEHLRELAATSDALSSGKAKMDFQVFYEIQGHNVLIATSDGDKPWEDNR